jgi:hypothetical protein
MNDLIIRLNVFARHGRNTFPTWLLVFEREEILLSEASVRDGRIEYGKFFQGEV